MKKRKERSWQTGAGSETRVHVQNLQEYRVSGETLGESDGYRGGVGDGRVLGRKEPL